MFYLDDLNCKSYMSPCIDYPRENLNKSNNSSKDRPFIQQKKSVLSIFLQTNVKKSCG